MEAVKDNQKKKLTQMKLLLATHDVQRLVHKPTYENTLPATVIGLNFEDNYFTAYVFLI